MAVDHFLYTNAQSTEDNVSVFRGLFIMRSIKLVKNPGLEINGNPLTNG